MHKVGSTLCTPQMDDDRIHTCLGRRRKVERSEVLERTAREGVAAEFWVGGNMEIELEQENHRCTEKYGGEALKNAATDVAMGRTIVFPVTQA